MRVGKVLHKLRGREMPPSGWPRPDSAAYNAFANYLRNEIDRQKNKLLMAAGVLLARTSVMATNWLGSAPVSPFWLTVEVIAQMCWP